MPDNLQLFNDRVDTPSANCCWWQMAPESYVRSTGLTTKNVCCAYCGATMEKMVSNSSRLTTLMA